MVWNSTFSLAVSAPALRILFIIVVGWIRPNRLHKFANSNDQDDELSWHWFCMGWIWRIEFVWDSTLATCQWHSMNRCRNCEVYKAPHSMSTRDRAHGAPAVARLARKRMGASKTKRIGDGFDWVRGVSGDTNEWAVIAIIVQIASKVSIDVMSFTRASWMRVVNRPCDQS